MSFSDLFEAGSLSFTDSGLNSLDTQKVNFSFIAKWMVKNVDLKLKSGSVEYTKALTGFTQSNMNEMEILSPANGVTLTQEQRDEVDISIKIDATTYDLGIVKLYLESVDFPNSSANWVISYSANVLNNVTKKIRVPSGLCQLYLKNTSNKTSNIINILGGGIPLSVRVIVSWDNPNADIDSNIKVSGISHKDSSAVSAIYYSWGNTGAFGLTNPFGGNLGYWDKDAHGDTYGDGHIETFLATTYLTGTTKTAGGITVPTGDHTLAIGNYELRCYLWGQGVPASSTTDMTVNITASFYVNEVFKFSQQKQVTKAMGDVDWGNVVETDGKGAIFSTLAFNNSDAIDLNDPITPLPPPSTLNPTVVEFDNVKDALVYELFLEGKFNTGAGDIDYSVKFGEITIPDRTYPVPKPIVAEII